MGVGPAGQLVSGQALAFILNAVGTMEDSRQASGVSPGWRGRGDSVGMDRRKKVSSLGTGESAAST